MITGGIATVFVSDFDRAVRFYTETLGLKLQNRFDNHWASIDAGNGTIIGLHPASEKSPAGRRGSITIGFLLNEPIGKVVERLRERGVQFSGPVIEDNAAWLAYFEDQDGIEFYFTELKPRYKNYR